MVISTETELLQMFKELLEENEYAISHAYKKEKELEEIERTEIEKNKLKEDKDA